MNNTKSKKMSGTDLFQKLANDKDIELGKVVQLALTDEHILKEIMNGLQDKKETYRFNCFKVLYQISQDQPEVLYPEWNFFNDHMNSKNSYHRIAALNILACLIRIDADKRFEEMFDRYFDLLDDQSMIVATYVARNAGRIAKAKPNLQKKITQKLLQIDKTHYEQDRKDLIKAFIIDSFEEYFDGYPEKDKILAFVEKLTSCESPKTVKTARAFIKKYQT